MFKLNNPPDRPRMMQESIETILKIWSQKPPYEFPGGYWDFQIKDAYRSDLGVGVMARPYQTPHPPIAVSIMSPRSSSARTAGAHGWIPISANFTPACHELKTQHGSRSLSSSPLRAHEADQVRTGVINLPQQHPRRADVRAFIFGIGPGGSPGDSRCSS